MNIKNTFKNVVTGTCHIALINMALFVVPAYASHNTTSTSSSSISASLSTDTISINAGETGSFTISGNDNGVDNFQFRWDIPSGLNITKGSSSNLNKFEIDWDKMRVKVESDARGSFSATIKVSASNNGTFVLTNTRAEISLNPKDVTVNIGSSGGTSSGSTSGGGSMDGGGMDGGDGGGGMGGGAVTAIPVLDATNVTLVVRQISRTMSDGNNVNFWVFCEDGMGGGGGGGCTLPSPVLELGVGQQANITLNMMMAPQEAAPYNGHTIHPHGVDVPTSEDGVPETGAGVNGDTYNFSVDSRYVGSHMYHCHVHTVKHLEMGMYGALIVKDGSNRINSGGPSYDFEWNMVMSTVDPAYHTAVQDSPVFADYNPRYFLINGQEGLSSNAPAEILTAAPGARVAIRLIGLHSSNARFEVRDGNGSRRNFTLHNIDGFALPQSRSVSSIEVSPGQTKDVMITLPSGSGSWYPEVSYRDLRNNNTYNNGRVFTRIDF